MNTQSKTPTPVSIDKEVLEITKGIWETEYCLDGSVFIKNDIEQDDYIALLQGEEHGQSHIIEANAKAICTAVNETYGKGYNPAAMEELVRALTIAVKHIKNIEAKYKPEQPFAVGTYETALNNSKL